MRKSKVFIGLSLLLALVLMLTGCAPKTIKAMDEKSDTKVAAASTEPTAKESVNQNTPTDPTNINQDPTAYGGVDNPIKMGEAFQFKSKETYVDYALAYDSTFKVVSVEPASKELLASDPNLSTTIEEALKDDSLEIYAVKIESDTANLSATLNKDAKDADVKPKFGYTLVTGYNIYGTVPVGTDIFDFITYTKTLGVDDFGFEGSVGGYLDKTHESSIPIKITGKAEAENKYHAEGTILVAVQKGIKSVLVVTPTGDRMEKQVCFSLN